MNRASFESDVMAKLTRDLEILSTKLCDIRGTPAANTTSGPGGVQKQAIAVVSSSFVSGIRKATELGGNPGDDRLSVLDRIVEKVTEYDREILKKTATADSTISRTREDLTSLPTHLHITGEKMTSLSLSTIILLSHLFNDPCIYLVRYRPSFGSLYPKSTSSKCPNIHSQRSNASRKSTSNNTIGNENGVDGQTTQ